VVGGLCPTTSTSATPPRKHSQKVLTLAEYEEGEVLCPHCGTDNVEQLVRVLSHHFQEERLRTKPQRH
jgi:hypothetical protein